MKTPLPVGYGHYLKRPKQYCHHFWTIYLFVWYGRGKVTWSGSQDAIKGAIQHRLPLLCTKNSILKWKNWKRNKFNVTVSFRATGNFDKRICLKKKISNNKSIISINNTLKKILTSIHKSRQPYHLHFWE